MRSFIKRIVTVAVLFSFASIAVASQSFIVHRIQIRGLQNLQSSTVRSYIPIHDGQRFDYQKSNQVLKMLYDSGFFYTASLGRHGSTLIVRVKERPMISEVKITGNKEIGTSKITPVLKKIGVSTGSMYDPMKLQLFDKSLEQQYSMLGYAATNVTTDVKNISHNRVTISIHVDEGQVVKVNSIHFIGNSSFSSSKLRHQFALTTPGILTWFNHKDRYSPYKLSKDIGSLTNFYLNHGYVRFQIKNKKIVYIRGRKRVNIYITVSEGPVYHISGFRITGQTLGFNTKLRKLVIYKVGDVFSRAQIIGSQAAINNFFADRAYAFAKVSVLPSIDDANHSVMIAYNVMTGKKVYVRRINFTGNNTTNQSVIRREMRQQEAAPYSLSKVNESKRRLLLTSYFSTADVSTTPVIGTNNQVDLDINVKERPSGKASIQGGYSSAYGFLYGASISQPNFLGSGKYVSLGFTNSQVTQNYSFSYVNPYYTWYHISRGFTVYYNRTRYQKQQFNFTPYVMNSLGADLNYGFPLSENNSLGVDFGYSRIDLSHLDGTGNLAPSVNDFLRITGTVSGNNVKRDYNVTKATATWTYNGLDRFLMPTKGVKNQMGLSLGVDILSNGLDYYTISDNFSAYVPLFHGFIIDILANVGYGGGFGKRNVGLAGRTYDPRLPFFNNFYAGGIGTVPGYSQNTLGPTYAPWSQYGGSALGGNLMTTAGIHFILPNFISQQVRIAFTFDAGNVFQAPVYKPDAAPRFTVAGDSVPTLPLVVNDERFALENLRMSAGVLVTWYTPFFGPIDLSFAFPLNKKKYDQEEKFQFAMGLSF